MPNKSFDDMAVTVMTSPSRRNRTPWWIAGIGLLAITATFFLWTPKPGNKSDSSAANASPLPTPATLAAAHPAASVEAAPVQAARTVVPLPAHGPLYPVKIDGAFGYVDAEGKVVLEPRWSGARFFSEGLAATRDGEKWGFIDATGRQVIPARYEAAGDFSEGLVRVKRGGRWGYIDMAENEVMAFVLDGAGDFHGGVANVCRKRRWWFVDRQGELAAGGQTYSVARSFSPEGLAAVNSGGWEGDDGKFYGGQWGFIDRNGREVIPRRYSDARDFHDGLAAVRGAEERWGYVNVAGTEVVPPALLAAGDFSDGRAPTIHDEGWGFIDASGRWAILADYPGVTRFVNGRALVSRGESGPHLWGLIDTNGAPVGPLAFDGPGDGFN